MSINIIKEEIDILIDTIREQHDIVKEYKGKIPQIELDIVMSNVRDLYEYLTELNKINNLRRTQQPLEVSTEILEKISTSKKEKTAVEAKDVIKEVIPEKEEVVAEIQEEVFTDTKEEVIAKNEEAVISDTITQELVSVVEESQKNEEVAKVLLQEEIIIESKPEEIIIEQIKEEVIIDSIQEEIEPEPNGIVITDEILEKVVEVEELKETEPKKEVKELKKSSKSEKPAIIDLFADSEKPNLSDKFKDEKKSLNEKLGEEKKEKSLADKIQKKPIKDLKTAIGINDKFIFINELFKGSLQEYNKAIEAINLFTSDKEAFSFIEELKEKYNWEEKADIYVKLEEFVLRKFL